MTGALPAPAASWQGKLDLGFACRPNVDGSNKTILSHSQVQAPLKVQRPFYPEGDAVCHSVILHTAGGLVGGDQLAVTVQLASNTQALITTAAATKVYRSQGCESQQVTHLCVSPGACLEWLPQETIVFNGALYRQHLKVDLAKTATWVGWDITRLGRTARGERFDRGEWRSKTEVWQNDRLLWIDPQWIQGGSEMMNSLHGLAGHPVMGSFAWLGQEVSREEVEHIRSSGRKQDLGTGQIGVTRLPTGLLCRYRGHSTAEARQWFRTVWALIRPKYLGRAVCPSRVWTDG